MRTILIAISFVLFTNFTFTQTLIDENKTWNVVTCMNFGGCSTQTLIIMGDTTINQMTYKKLYYSDDEIPEDWYLLNALREDLDTQQVFIYYFYEGEEKLLYDFNLVVGDTFQSPLCPDFEMTLGSIETITLENGEQRTLYSFGYGEQWVSGIGSLNGLLSVGYNYCNMDIWKKLSCCHEAYELIYMSPEYSDCYVFTIGLEDESKQDYLSIFPNPSTGNVTLQFNDLVFNNMIIEVFNMSGQLVFTQNIQSTRNEESIDLNTLLKGIYTINLQTDQFRFVEKLMIE